MNKINIFFAIGLIFIAGCAQQAETPEKLKVPVPESGNMQEIVVAEEAPAEPEAGSMQEPITGSSIEPAEKPKKTVREFTMTAKRFEFNPGTITVNKGDTVKLAITSMDVAHGFRLAEFGINERLEPGEPVKIEFVADKIGTFTFSCSVPCGSGHGGMNGQLIVE